MHWLHGGRRFQVALRLESRALTLETQTANLVQQPHRLPVPSTELVESCEHLHSLESARVPAAEDVTAQLHVERREGEGLRLRLWLLADEALHQL